jgi:hypothetical protein
MARTAMSSIQLDQLQGPRRCVLPLPPSPPDVEIQLQNVRNYSLLLAVFVVMTCSMEQAPQLTTQESLYSVASNPREFVSIQDEDADARAQFS